MKAKEKKKKLYKTPKGEKVRKKEKKVVDKVVLV